MDEADPNRALAPPPWLRPDIHTAMRRAYDRKVAAGRDPAAAGAGAPAPPLAPPPGAGAPRGGGGPPAPLDLGRLEAPPPPAAPGRVTTGRRRWRVETAPGRPSPNSAPARASACSTARRTPRSWWRRPCRSASPG